MIGTPQSIDLLGNLGETRRARIRPIGRPALLAVLAPLVILGLALTLALTATHAPTRHSYAPVVAQKTLSTTNGYPAVGGAAISSDAWSGGPFVSASLVDRTTITGHPSPAVSTLKGTEVGVLPGGTLRSTFTGTQTRRADGSLAIVKHGTFGGGTGIYAHATGTYAFDGYTAAGSNVSNGRFHGSLAY